MAAPFPSTGQVLRPSYLPAFGKWRWRKLETLGETDVSIAQLYHITRLHSIFWTTYQGSLFSKPLLHKHFHKFISSFLSLFSFTQRSGIVPTHRMWDGRGVGGGVCFAAPPRLWFLRGWLVCLFVVVVLSKPYSDRGHLRSHVLSVGPFKGAFACIGVWWVSKWRHCNQLLLCCRLSHVLKV